MKGYSFNKPIHLQSIVVFTSPCIGYSDMELEAVVSNFFETAKGKWVKKHAASVTKQLTYTFDGDTMIQVTAIFTEQKRNFFILKWR